jgi:hypothetical protein
MENLSHSNNSKNDIITPQEANEKIKQNDQSNDQNEIIQRLKFLDEKINKTYDKAN